MPQTTRVTRYTVKDEKTGKSYLVIYYHIGTIGEHNLGSAYVDKILDLHGIPSNSSKVCYNHFKMIIKLTSLNFKGRD
jgi:hypothetical protein